jgi:hypothetical protein
MRKITQFGTATPTDCTKLHATFRTMAILFCIHTPQAFPLSLCGTRGLTMLVMQPHHLGVRAHRRVILITILATPMGSRICRVCRHRGRAIGDLFGGGNNGVRLSLPARVSGVPRMTARNGRIEYAKETELLSVLRFTFRMQTRVQRGRQASFSGSDAEMINAACTRRDSPSAILPTPFELRASLTFLRTVAHLKSPCASLATPTASPLNFTTAAPRSCSSKTWTGFDIN